MVSDSFLRNVHCLIPPPTTFLLLSLPSISLSWVNGYQGNQTLYKRMCFTDMIGVKVSSSAEEMFYLNRKNVGEKRTSVTLSIFYYCYLFEAEIDNTLI